MTRRFMLALLSIILLGDTAMGETCTVVNSPTGTPLNVRRSPNDSDDSVIDFNPWHALSILARGQQNAKEYCKKDDGAENLDFNPRHEWKGTSHGGEFAVAFTKAVRVHGRGVDREFTNLVGRMYEALPRSLREVLEPIDIHVFDTQKTYFEQAQKVLGGEPPRKIPPGVDAVTRTFDNTDRVAISFIQGNMKRYSADEKQKVVVHEAMHVVDSRNDPKLSTDAAFLKAYETDVNLALKVLSDPKAGERLKGNIEHFAYYFSDLEEAWAETAARLLYSPKSMQAENEFYGVLFKNTMKAVNDQLWPATPGAPAAPGGGIEE
jgi:hypothetical protein